MKTDSRILRPAAALTCAALCALLPLPTHAEAPGTAPGLRGTQTATSEQSETPPPDEKFWQDLNEYASSYSVSVKKKKSSARTDESARLDWSRSARPAVGVKRAIPTPWDTKVGADISLAPQGYEPVSPQRVIPGTAVAQSSGAAYVRTTAPALGLPFGWDKAAIEARLDPGQEQGRLGATFDKSLPLGQRFSLNVENGFAATGTLANATAAVAAAPAQTYSAEGKARLQFLPTGTSVITGGTFSTADGRWLNGIGIEQKLPGGVNVSGAVRETITGAANHSVAAGFKRTW